LAVFNDDKPQTPSDFKIEQSGLSISVTYWKENANVFYFKLIDLLLFSAKWAVFQFSLPYGLPMIKTKCR
jgi:hypothetical protein